MTGAHERSLDPRRGAGWTLAGLARAAAVASVAIGVGAGLGYLIAHERAPARAGDGPGESRPAGAAELALLAPLGPGSALADFEVVEIQAVSAAGTLGVVCERGDTRVRLEVALPAKAGPTPPAMAGQYAIFYATGAATSKDGERLALALSAILERNAAAPVPPGMRPFTPISARSSAR